MKNFSLILTLLLFIRCTSNIEVDLIVHNAKVYTVDSAFTIQEAFAIKNGIFIDIGTNKHILERYKAKEIINANQKPIYPGFYDGHAHTFMYADYLQEVDLVGCHSIEDLIERLKAYQKKNPDKKWIVGGGWDQSLWVNKQYPHRDTLDKYFPETPIFLSRIDYHAAVVNSVALKLAQIDTAFYVEGGKIDLDKSQRMTGVLVDNAMDLVSKYIPSGNEENILKKLQQAQDSLFSVGLTSVVDAGLNSEELELLKKYYTEDSLKIRNYAMIFVEPHEVNKYISEGIYESDRLDIRSVKLMADGALGSRGACMLENYSDDSTKGFLLHPRKEFEEALSVLAKSPFQVAIHAIGDSANRMLLDLYGQLDIKNKRWRIEHAQVINPADFSKFKAYNIIPSIQPTHATSDMNWLYERIGKERSKGAYANQKLLSEYGKVVIGTDFPVEHINPLYSFHAAVARQDHRNMPEGGFQMENALSREDALRGMTIWAAYGSFQEKKRGSIERGKDADFVILEDDIMTTAKEKLRNIKILRTCIAGESVYIRQ